MPTNFLLWFRRLTRILIRIGALSCSLFTPANWRTAWQYMGAYLESVEDVIPYGSPVIPPGMVRRNGEGRSILLYTHELSRTGAPQALLHMAQSLRRLYGVSPVVLSPKPGPLGTEFERHGFSVVVDAAHTTGQRSAFLADYVGSFDLVVVNSIVSAPFIARYAKYCQKMAVWIHEPGTALAGLPNVFFGRDLRLLREAPFSLWLVSGLCVPIADTLGKEYVYLHYGLPEATLPATVRDAGVTTFLLVGELCRRKGQLLFLNAIQGLPRALRKRGRFLVIGGDQYDPGYARKVKKKASVMGEVRVELSMPFADLLERYARSDCIVCPSEIDPMPIVVSHGFMFNMPAIVSDAVGQALLPNSAPGLTTVPVGEVRALADAIAKFMEQREAGELQPAETRPMFDAHFSTVKFEQILKNLVDKHLRGC